MLKLVKAGESVEVRYLVEAQDLEGTRSVGFTGGEIRGFRQVEAAAACKGAVTVCTPRTDDAIRLLY